MQFSDVMDLAAIDHTYFARTGPGTIAGEFLRRFWQPIARIGDLPERSARRVALLGQHYTLLRFDGDQHSLVQDRCAHRGMPLCTGEVDDTGVRCAYHGWRFGSDGACTEAPPEGAEVRRRAGIRRYPLRAAFGLWFAYLGPGEPAAFPFDNVDLESLTPYRFAPIEWPCGFMLRVENTTDVSHIGGIHRTSGLSAFLPSDFQLELSPAPFGHELRLLSGGDRYGAPLRYFVPNAFEYSQPLVGGQPWMDHLTWHVPIDDHNTRTWTVVLVPPTDTEAWLRKNPEPSKGDAEVVRQAQRILAGETSLRELREHQNLTEIEDCVAVCGQELTGGAEPSVLGDADAGVASVRRMLGQRLTLFASTGQVDPLPALGAAIPSPDDA